MTELFIAYRDDCIVGNPAVMARMFVERTPDKEGKDYSYTNEQGKAMPLTESQCRKFVRYLASFGRTGYYMHASK